MSVTIVKQAKKTSVTKAAIKALVDALTEYKAVLDSAKAVQKQYDTGRKKLLEFIPDVPPDMPITFEGSHSVASFAACSKERKITNMKALHKMLGDEVFYKVCSVKLADVDAYLSEDESAAILSEQFGTTRILTIKPKE
jgi:hypothetical protein